jgi:hypothetical protein
MAVFDYFHLKIDRGMVLGKLRIGRPRAACAAAGSASPLGQPECRMAEDPSNVPSKNDEIRSLALEVIEDVEMSRISTEGLVLKASRLARLANEEEEIRWLFYERFGYITDEEVSIRYLGYTSRWIDPNDHSKGAYWGPASPLESMLEPLASQLEVIKNYRPSGENAAMDFLNQEQRAVDVGDQINAIRRIVSIVRGLIQQFATTIYYEKVFSQQAEAIFTQYQNVVDGLLATTAKTAFTRLPQAFERLAAEDPEAISHALTTCRRVIDSFADAVYPPRSEPALIGEQRIDVGSEQKRNRIYAYIYERIGRGSRYDRLRQGIASLYGRVSVGVHADVTVGEARALVLQTYLCSERSSLYRPSRANPPCFQHGSDAADRALRCSDWPTV